MLRASSRRDFLRTAAIGTAALSLGRETHGQTPAPIAATNLADNVVEITGAGGEADLFLSMTYTGMLRHTHEIGGIL